MCIESRHDHDRGQIHVPTESTLLLTVRVPVEELPRGTVGKDGPNKSEKSGVVTTTKMDVNRSGYRWYPE